MYAIILHIKLENKDNSIYYTMIVSIRKKWYTYKVNHKEIIKHVNNGAGSYFYFWFISVPTAEIISHISAVGTYYVHDEEKKVLSSRQNQMK